MAPRGSGRGRGRGRPRKRLSRMDAAIDAMTAFGFDEPLVHKTVKKLLKEYGGDDGWAFIEEYAYKELIDAILRHQDEHTKGVSSQDERAEDLALQSILGPSGTLVDSTCNKVGEASCSDLFNAVEPTHIKLCSTEVFCPTPAEGHGNSWKDIEEGQISTQKETSNGVCCVVGNSGNQVQPGSNSHVFAAPPTSSPCPVNYLKMCSASQVQSGHISTLPLTASLCPVNHLLPPADTTLPSSKGVSSQDERAEDDPALESTLVDFTAGNTLGETACSKLVDAVGEPTLKELCSNKQDIGSSEVLYLPPAEGDGHRYKDIREDQTSTQKGTTNVVGNSVLQAGSNSHVTTLPPTSSPCPVISLPLPADHRPITLPSSKRVCLQPPRRRFPCYGWIESDDEEDPDDFIELAPVKCVEFSK